MSVEGYRAAIKEAKEAMEALDERDVDEVPPDLMVAVATAASAYAQIAQAEILEALLLAFQTSQGHGPMRQFLEASEEKEGE